MIRILAYRLLRHYSTRFKIFLCIVILVVLLCINVNITSMQGNPKSKHLEIQRIEDTESSVTDTVLKQSFKKEVVKNGLRMGRVNLNIWYNVCTISMDSMRQHPLYPLWPSARSQPQITDDLESFSTELWAFQRVLGYLYPPMSGNYKFRIFSETMSEFWMSSNNNPGKASLLAKNNAQPWLSAQFSSGQRTHTSKPVHLNQGEAYYFEIQDSVNYVRTGKVRVRWMLPGNREYTGIPKTSVSTFIDGNDNLAENVIKSLTSSASLPLRESMSKQPLAYKRINKTFTKPFRAYSNYTRENFHTDYLAENVRELLTSSASLPLRESILKQPLTYEWINKTFAEPFEAYSNYTRENFHTVEFADRWKIMSVFNECDYVPSYTRRRKYELYEAVDFTHFTDVFPYDDTAGKQWEGTYKEIGFLGNANISEYEVIHIVNMFMMAVEGKFPGEYALANVINVERNLDKEIGNRFLLELILRELMTNKIQRVSEYVYRYHKKPNVLYNPKGVRWIPNTKINTILTAKNQGGWVIHYIENMARIIHATGDKNVHFIVVDYGNNGVDIAAEFKRYLDDQTMTKATTKYFNTIIY